MTQAQYDILFSSVKNKLEEAYALQNEKKAEQYFKIIDVLSKDFSSFDGKPMSLKEAIQLAHLFHEAEELCNEIDEIMGFKKGESYRQEDWLTLCKGAVVDVPNSHEVVLSSCLFYCPTKTFGEYLKAVSPNEFPRKNKVTIHGGFEFENYYPLREFKDRAVSVLFEVYVTFREYKDGTLTWRIDLSHIPHKIYSSIPNEAISKIWGTWGFLISQPELRFLY